MPRGFSILHRADISAAQTGPCVLQRGLRARDNHGPRPYKPTSRVIAGAGCHESPTDRDTLPFSPRSRIEPGCFQETEQSVLRPRGPGGLNHYSTHCRWKRNQTGSITSADVARIPGLRVTLCKTPPRLPECPKQPTRFLFLLRDSTLCETSVAETRGRRRRRACSRGPVRKPRERRTNGLGQERAFEGIESKTRVIASGAISAVRFLVFCFTLTSRNSGALVLLPPEPEGYLIDGDRPETGSEGMFPPELPLEMQVKNKKVLNRPVTRGIAAAHLRLPRRPEHEFLRRTWTCSGVTSDGAGLLTPEIATF
ncbi:hypothetical protein LX36DRAFT_660596 [Colletotrichum falcatum]|nr:hypothetical protein LX36DRAFT_660596 [Colletotrichum falcatum]